MLWLYQIATSLFGRIAVIASAVISILSFVYLKGKKDQKEKDKSTTMKESLEAIERRDNVERNDSVDAALERLRKSGDVRD